MSETADVVVVGGGVVGVSAAFHLATAGAGRVVLLERDDAVGTRSTGRCAGGFRHQFSSRINVELSLASVPMIVGFGETHGLPLDVVQDGYLFLLRTEEEVAAFRAAGDLQRSLGVDARELTPEEAAELVPGLSVDGVLAATFCPDDGIADPAGLTQGYATVARRAGADLRLGVTVTGVTTDGDRVTGVDTSDGPIGASVVVNAAGPWAGVLAASAGVTLPLEPIPRNVVTTGAFPGVPERRTLVIDAGTSCYFHREGEGVLMGMGDPDERPSFETVVDERFVAERLLPTAVSVFPPLVEAGVASSWCGLYEMTPDRHPIVGSAPVEGFWLANGFSGHGFQHAPVVGKILAELIVDGEARTVDVTELGFERFAAGRLTAEGHVV
ncbi:MAG: NAD(P)/FAD-dependent oxidoreductase [Actinomycetota bacterium]